MFYSKDIPDESEDEDSSPPNINVFSLYGGYKIEQPAPVKFLSKSANAKSGNNSTPSKADLSSNMFDGFSNHSSIALIKSTCGSPSIQTRSVFVFGVPSANTTLITSTSKSDTLVKPPVASVTSGFNCSFAGVHIPQSLFRGPCSGTFVKRSTIAPTASLIGSPSTQTGSVFGVSSQNTTPSMSITSQTTKVYESPFKDAIVTSIAGTNSDSRKSSIAQETSSKFDIPSTSANVAKSLLSITSSSSPSKIQSMSLFPGPASGTFVKRSTIAPTASLIGSPSTQTGSVFGVSSQNTTPSMSITSQTTKVYESPFKDAIVTSIAGTNSDSRKSSIAQETSSKFDIPSTSANVAKSLLSITSSSSPSKIQSMSLFPGPASGTFVKRSTIAPTASLIGSPSTQTGSVFGVSSQNTTPSMLITSKTTTVYESPFKDAIVTSITGTNADPRESSIAQETTSKFDIASTSANVAKSLWSNILNSIPSQIQSISNDSLSQSNFVNIPKPEPNFISGSLGPEIKSEDDENEKDSKVGSIFKDLNKSVSNDDNGSSNEQVEEAYDESVKLEVKPDVGKSATINPNDPEIKSEDDKNENYNKVGSIFKDLNISLSNDDNGSSNEQVQEAYDESTKLEMKPDVGKSATINPNDPEIKSDDEDEKEKKVGSIFKDLNISVPYADNGSSNEQVKEAYDYSTTLEMKPDAGKSATTNPNDPERKSDNENEKEKKVGSIFKDLNISVSNADNGSSNEQVEEVYDDNTTLEMKPDDKFLYYWEK